MDLRQLATLVAVADHRSFSAAAKSPVHGAVERLRARRQARARAGRHPLRPLSRSQLTEAGQLVVARARRVLGELDALRSDLTSLGADVAGDARIGVIPTTARWLLPRLLDRLRGRAPPGAARGLGRHDGVAAPPAHRRHARRRRVRPARRRPRPARGAAVRGGSRAGRAARATRWPSAAASRWPSSPGVELLLEAPGTSLRDGLDRAATAVGVRLERGGRGRRRAAPRRPGRRRPRRQRSCRSRRCPPHSTGLVKVPVTQLPPRVVGIVRSRRGLPSAPSVAVLVAWSSSSSGTAVPRSASGPSWRASSTAAPPGAGAV